MVSIDSISSSIAAKDNDVAEQAQTPEDKLAKQVEAKKAEAKAKAAKSGDTNSQTASANAKQVDSSQSGSKAKNASKSTEFNELLTQTQVNAESNAKTQDQKKANEKKLEALTKDGNALKTDAKMNSTHSGNQSIVRRKNVSQDALLELAAAGLAANASQTASQSAIVPKLTNEEAISLQNKLIQNNPNLMQANQKPVNVNNIQGSTGPVDLQGFTGKNADAKQVGVNPTGLNQNPQMGMNPQQVVPQVIVNVPPPVIMAIPVDMNERDLISVDSLNNNQGYDGPMSAFPAAFAGISTEDYMNDRSSMLHKPYGLTQNSDVLNHREKSFRSNIQNESTPLWLSDPYAGTQPVMIPQVMLAGQYTQPNYTQSVSQTGPTAEPRRTVDISNPTAVSGQIWGLANRGGGEVKVKINPVELGELTIRVSNEKGKLSVKMESQSKEAQEILKSSLPELREHLMASKYDVARIEVSGNSIHSHKISNGSDSIMRSVGVNPWEIADMNKYQSGRDSNDGSNSNNQGRYPQQSRDDYFGNQQQGRGNGYKRYYEQYSDV